MLYKLFINLITSFCLPFSSGTSCKDRHFGCIIYTDLLTVFSEAKLFRDVKNTKCLTHIVSLRVRLQKSSLLSLYDLNESKKVCFN